MRCCGEELKAFLGLSVQGWCPRGGGGLSVSLGEAVLAATLEFLQSQFMSHSK